MNLQQCFKWLKELWSLIRSSCDINVTLKTPSITIFTDTDKVWWKFTAQSIKAVIICSATSVFKFTPMSNVVRIRQDVASAIWNDLRCICNLLLVSSSAARFAQQNCRCKWTPSYKLPEAAILQQLLAFFCSLCRDKCEMMKFWHRSLYQTHFILPYKIMWVKLQSLRSTTRMMQRLLCINPVGLVILYPKVILS